MVLFLGRCIIRIFGNLCLFFLGGGFYILKLVFFLSFLIFFMVLIVVLVVVVVVVVVSNGVNFLGFIGFLVYFRCMVGSFISIVMNGVKELNGDVERNGLSFEYLISFSF